MHLKYADQSIQASQDIFQMNTILHVRIIRLKLQRYSKPQVICSASWLMCLYSSDRRTTLRDMYINEIHDQG